MGLIYILIPDNSIPFQSRREKIAFPVSKQQFPLQKEIEEKDAKLKSYKRRGDTAEY